jgi:ribonucleotide reductase alpha subunit
MFPTNNELKAYSGENIASKLSGDIKEAEKQLNVLCQRAYEQIVDNLVGIKTLNLTDDEETDWKTLIMEQIVYLLSVGDRSLQGKYDYIVSPEVEKKAKRYDLWRPNFSVKQRVPFGSNL